jgi:hypothetical protein
VFAGLLLHSSSIAVFPGANVEVSVHRLDIYLTLYGFLGIFKFVNNKQIGHKNLYSTS